MQNVSNITLSYTFFKTGADDEAEEEQEEEQEGRKKSANTEVVEIK